MYIPVQYQWFLFQTLEGRRQWQSRDYGYERQSSADFSEPLSRSSAHTYP